MTSPKIKNTPIRKKLLQVAAQSQKNSHSPYSSCSVGAAVLFSNGNIYGGCNIENSSYGGTTCAERVAIGNAVSHQGASTIQEILVIGPTEQYWPPCGLCLQVISEFSDSKTLIHSATPNGIQKSWTLKQLLPEAFSKNFLFKKR